MSTVTISVDEYDKLIASKSEWHPIETAPKGDDPYIQKPEGFIHAPWILLARVGGPVWTGRWYHNSRYRYHQFEGYRAYFTSSDENDFPTGFDGPEDFANAQPTHWMPLPSPLYHNE